MFSRDTMFHRDNLFKIDADYCIGASGSGSDPLGRSGNNRLTIIGVYIVFVWTREDQYAMARRALFNLERRLMTRGPRDEQVSETCDPNSYIYRNCTVLHHERQVQLELEFQRVHERAGFRHWLCNKIR